MAYTTTSLLSAIERQSFSPADQETFTSTEILALADEVLKTSVIPEIMKVREEYFIFSKNTTLTANQTSVRIPARSIGLTLREVKLLDSAGNFKKELIHISLDRSHEFSSTSSCPEAFYLKGDNLILVPTPTTGGDIIKMDFPLRPGDHVALTSAAVISAINTSTNVVTVTTIPSTWVTGNKFDLIQQDGGHKYLDIDLTSSLVSGTDITLPSLPTDLAVGDYIALQGQSPVVQLPPDFQPVLATLTAAEILLAQDLPSGEKVLIKGLKALSSAVSILTPRVVGEMQVIMPDWS